MVVQWCGGEEWEAEREPSKWERRSHRDCEGVEVKLVYLEESEKVSVSHVQHPPARKPSS